MGKRKSKVREPPPSRFTVSLVYLDRHRLTGILSVCGCIGESDHQEDRFSPHSIRLSLLQSRKDSGMQTVPPPPPHPHTLSRRETVAVEAHTSPSSPHLS